jgi:hypothetical protein
MRARFWLWTALAVFGAACGLDPQPGLTLVPEHDVATLWRALRAMLTDAAG